MISMKSDGTIVHRKGKDVDFVFVYELKIREIQGIALIAYELVRRGYSVGFVNTWHGLHNDDVRYNAKVAIVFEAYNTSVIQFALSFIGSCKNVFNMQWEQILSDECFEPGSVYVLEGQANQVYHAAWGEKNYEHLTDYCHIPSEMVKIVGHVGHDFLQNELAAYYLNRNELCKQYSIDPNRKMVLFISSFADPDLRGDEMEHVMIESQKTIANWLARYADEDKNTTVVYRPHPTEIVDPDFQKALEKNSNIRIISDYSIQQWIKVSDIILNWWSTSLGDVYAAGKTCLFLRPLTIPKRDEYYIFEGAKVASSYEEMIEQIRDNVLPIDKDEVNKYYYHDDSKAAYQRIADILIELYEGEAKYEFVNNTIKPFKERGVLLSIREYYGWIKYKILSIILKKPDLFQEVGYHFTMTKRAYMSEKEIVKMMNKIGGLLGEKL